MSIKLTQYSHGAGCGCKIAPAVLDEILKNSKTVKTFKNLLVGNNTKDDAAAFDLGNGTSVLSTTDFFMPIVDEPFVFGKIAATNALSDIYAMGGKPLMAISIFGWPLDKLSAEVAKEVIEGGRYVCEQAGIPLAGGHSIDSPEPIFGLAVTGLVENKFLKQNNTAKKDCFIFLTKPVGIGILTTAKKMGVISDGELKPAIDAMCTLNKAGYEFAKIKGVTAITDVTGFGLLGHLCEICEGSNVGAVVYYDKVPLFNNVKKYMKMGCIPGGNIRNYKSYGHNIGALSDEQKNILCDAQTSGGLIVIVKKDCADDFMKECENKNISLWHIGETFEKEKQSPYIKVI